MTLKSSCAKHLILFLLTASVIAQASPPDQAVQKAAHILKTANFTGGLIIQIGYDNPALTVALRANANSLVQALDTKPANVDKARQQLTARGIYGPVTADTFDGIHLPYTDNLVNLIIVSNSHPCPPRNEIMRVLAPHGVALINGRALTKPWPEDIDQWTHFLHAPDNNAVAQDTQIAPPKYTQWVAAPKWGRSHDHLSNISAAVSAAGRIFYIADEGSIAAVTQPANWVLIARDAFNGVLLWKKPIPKWEDHLRPFRSGPAELPRRLVAVDDTVYVTLGYNRPVSALDAATGKLIRTYEGTDNTHEILLHGPNLYLVISDPLEEQSPTTGKVLRNFPLWRDAYLEFVTQYMPKHIRAINARSGKLLWKKHDKESADILPLTLTIDDNRLFFQNTDQLIALDASSGDALWRADRPAPRHRYAWLTPTVVATDGVVLSADRSHLSPVDTGGTDNDRIEWRVSSNHLLTGGEIMAFSAQTGKQLWAAPCHEGFNSPADVFVIDGKVFSGILAWGRQPGITDVYDLHTGKVVARRSPDRDKFTLGFGHTRCYRHKATSRYIINGRAGLEFLPIDQDTVDAHHWIRGACQYGILPANGLVYAPTHPCACYITAKLSGFNALAATRRPTPEVKQPDPLQKGPAYTQAAKLATAAPNDRNDWPTYRADNARSSSATTAVSPDLVPKWQRTLPGPLTAVTVAQNKLFVAQKQANTLHALNAHNGAPLWQYTTAGRIDSPPTIHKGLAYFGSADGYIYCLRADNGQLAWRYRLAPESRQIVSYDRLESNWPVHGSVLVCADCKDPSRAIAYAVAGRSSYVDGGLYLCGLDALTGIPVMQRHIYHRDPQTHREPQDVIRGVNMPGAMPDVLSTDGASIFMRHFRLDYDGRTLEPNVNHLFKSIGFLDDTWWHRTYFQIGTEMRGGYGGWPTAGNTRISGKALVRNAKCAFGFGRKGYTITGSHIGLQSQYHLFAADITPAQPTPQKKKPQKSPIKYRWSKDIPFYPRAMLLSAETLFIAGPQNVADFDTANPTGPIHLWAVSTETGTPLAKYNLDAAPTYDSLAAAQNNLYLTTTNHKILCYQPK